jgi:hypothetical protein
VEVAVLVRAARFIDDESLVVAVDGSYSSRELGGEVRRKNGREAEECGAHRRASMATGTWQNPTR